MLPFPSFSLGSLDLVTTGLTFILGLIGDLL